jgi:iron complex outermembrane recepter protein
MVNLSDLRNCESGKARYFSQSPIAPACRPRDRGRLTVAACCAVFAVSGLARWAAAADAPDETGLQEITVTAEKYNSTIQNTPISMSALSGDQLTAAGITSVEDFTREVPGFSVRSAGPGQTEYEARGMASNGGAAPTVGFYLDEVPLSPPALAQVGKVVIDPNLYDVNRIEALRGPQGTLYGSGSMGGTVKIITNQPVLNDFESSFQGTLSDTEGGSGNGGGNLMFNIPLGSLFAARLVASDTYRSGWIDRVTENPFPTYPTTTVGFPAGSPGPNWSRPDVENGPVQGIKTNANTEDLYGERISLLFKPNDDFSILGTALYQRMVMGAYDEFDNTPDGPYGEARYQPFDIPEPVTDTIHIYSLTLTANVGFADLTSATSYWNRAESQTQDASESGAWTVQSALAFASGPLNPPGGGAVSFPAYAPLPYTEADLTHQFSQEVRLSSRGDDRLHWTAGVFYSDLHSAWDETSFNPAYSVLSAPGTNPEGYFFNSRNPYEVRQSAVFADGSYKITDSLKFSTGLRWYRYQSQATEFEYGIEYPTQLTPADVIPATTTASDSGFNPRFNLSYAPNGDLTTYVSASKGFRPGGANEQVPASLCGKSPSSFGSDSAWDYEVGEKARLFDNWLNINSDFYYIKWSNIQVAPELTCGYEYDTNAGNGRSFGPELEINAKLSESWTVIASGATTDAKITHPNASYITFLTQTALVQTPDHPNGTPFCATASGCTAPILNVPKETASLALVYATDVMQHKFTARVDDSFVGTSIDSSYFFDIHLPSYNIANARLSLAGDRWVASLFVDNLTNRVALLTANNTNFEFNIPGVVRYSTNQPRTYGTQINYRF